jgi:hypothetical protein
MSDAPHVLWHERDRLHSEALRAAWMTRHPSAWVVPPRAPKKETRAQRLNREAAESTALWVEAADG